MKKDLKDIILNSVPKKYHNRVNFVIDKYDTIQETYYFRINLLIGFALIVIGLSKLRQALILKNVNTKWIGTLLVSILILILGFLLVFNPFSGVAITKLAGAFLLIVAIFNVVDNCVFQK